MAERKALRRRRLDRSRPEHSLTPAKALVLLHVAECGMLTTGQVARVAGMTRRAVYDHLRDLYDLGLLSRAQVPRVWLVPESRSAGPYAAMAPSEVIHVPTRKAMQALAESGMLPPYAVGRKIPDLDAGSGLLVAHEAMVREARIWLDLCARARGEGGVEMWQDFEAAHLSAVQPDALAAYRLPDGRLLGIAVEADRATESSGRWADKAAKYDAVPADEWERRLGTRLLHVAALCPDAARRDAVARFAEGTALGRRLFVASVGDMIGSVSLADPLWARPGQAGLHPMAAPELA